MFFVFLLPLAAFIVFAVIGATLRRKAAPANSEQTNPDPKFAGDVQKTKPSAPARPTVQPNVKPVQKSTMAPRLRTEPEAKPVRQAPTAPHEPVRVQQPQAPVLTFSGSDAMRGILYAEILGKPKALRKT